MTRSDDQDAPRSLSVLECVITSATLACANLRLTIGFMNGHSLVIDPSTTIKRVGKQYWDVFGPDGMVASLLSGNAWSLKHQSE